MKYRPNHCSRLPSRSTRSTTAASTRWPDADGAGAAGPPVGPPGAPVWRAVVGGGGAGRPSQAHSRAAARAASRAAGSGKRIRTKVSRVGQARKPLVAPRSGGGVGPQGAGLLVELVDLAGEL